jgi:hypothetical protein
MCPLRVGAGKTHPPLPMVRRISINAAARGVSGIVRRAFFSCRTGLEARAPSVDELRSVLINFLDADGSVTSSLLSEPGKLPTNIPASAATSEAPRPLKTRRS